MNASIQNDSRASKYQQHIAEKLRARRARVLRRIIKTSALIAAIGGVIAGGAWFIATRPSVPEEEVIARRGIHWHPHLSVVIRGEPQEIPANIGLSATVHKPIHTHDATGELHLEFDGLVTRDDIRLKRFFEVWGKHFSRECIFDACNGPGGTVKMVVNGEENQEFGDYIMRDGDRIEIRFE